MAVLSRNKGWTFKDRFWPAIRNMPKPRKIADLTQAVHVVQWLKVTVGFAEVRLGDTRGKPKKLSKEQRTFITWSQEANKAWNNFKIVLEHTSRQNIAHYDHTKEILLLTDASKHFWSGVILQINPLRKLLRVIGTCTSAYTSCPPRKALSNKI